MSPADPTTPEPGMTMASSGIMCGPDGCQPIDAATAQAIYDSAMRQQADRVARMPDEATALRTMFDGFVRLKELGWRDATYAPDDGSALELIEAGSTGIHSGYRDAERRFWIDDDDVTWPSTPVLFRAARAPLTGRADDGQQQDQG
jgi:hypothetical protein